MLGRTDRDGYTIWDASTGRQIRSLGNPYGVWVGDRQLFFTPDGAHLIVRPSGEHTVEGKRVVFALWNVATGQIDRQFFQPTADFFVVANLAVSTAANRLAVAYGGPGPRRNRPIIIYDTRTWQIVNVKVPFPEIVGIGVPYGLDLSPDGSQIAMGHRRLGPGGRGTIWIHDVETGRLVRTIEQAHHNTISVLKYDQTGARLMSAAPTNDGASADGKTGQLIPDLDTEPVRVWSVETGEKLASFPDILGTSARSSAGSTTRALAVNMQRPLAIIGNSESTFWLWDIRTSAVVARTEKFPDTYFAAAAFSPDGTRVAITENASRVAIFDVGRFGLD
jgi:WD40 repeat protein